MAQPRGYLPKDGRSRARTPAERADEAANTQQRLKREAAARRDIAARKSGPTERLRADAPPPPPGELAGPQTP